MGNLSGFDANAVAEQQDFTALPAGSYVAIATASQMKPTSNHAQTGNEFLEFTFEVIEDGPYKGRKVWARMNLKNQSVKAVEIAQIELGALCRAVGVPKPNDSSELHNRPVRLKVEVEVGQNNKEQNEIKKYETATAAGAPTAPAPFQAPAPSQAAAPAAKAPWAK